MLVFPAHMQIFRCFALYDFYRNFCASSAVRITKSGYFSESLSTIPVSLSQLARVYAVRSLERGSVACFRKVDTLVLDLASLRAGRPGFRRFLCPEKRGCKIAQSASLYNRLFSFRFLGVLSKVYFCSKWGIICPYKEQCYTNRCVFTTFDDAVRDRTSISIFFSFFLKPIVNVVF